MVSSRCVLCARICEMLSPCGPKEADAILRPTDHIWVLVDARSCVLRGKLMCRCSAQKERSTSTSTSPVSHTSPVSVTYMYPGVAG